MSSWSGRKRGVAAVGAALGLAFIGIQFVPAGRTNRIGAGDPSAPREVQWVLRRACYDCHSTETRWPIWAYVAPMSWSVVDDVNRARRVLNFSDWAAYSEQQQKAMRQTIAWSTSEHRMPLWYYVTLHPDSRLTPQDLRALAQWAYDSVPGP